MPRVEFSGQGSRRLWDDALFVLALETLSVREHPRSPCSLGAEAPSPLISFSHISRTLATVGRFDARVFQHISTVSQIGFVNAGWTAPSGFFGRFC